MQRQCIASVAGLVEQGLARGRGEWQELGILARVERPLLLRTQRLGRRGDAARRDGPAPSRWSTSSPPMDSESGGSRSALGVRACRRIADPADATGRRRRLLRAVPSPAREARGSGPVRSGLEAAACVLTGHGARRHPNLGPVHGTSASVGYPSDVQATNMTAGAVRGDRCRDRARRGSTASCPSRRRLARGPLGVQRRARRLRLGRAGDQRRRPRDERDPGRSRRRPAADADGRGRARRAGDKRSEPDPGSPRAAASAASVEPARHPGAAARPSVTALHPSGRDCGASRAGACVACSG